ncbi:MAG TPA: 1-acyl-sn-glycerol-3-phosphate acyltransferase [Bacteroidales bacterium]|nr:1-acyl-sn-glycerol-3-phosphate acyltransferase [Bacteroidales bacterium]
MDDKVQEREAQLIDIKEVIRSKNATLARVLPGFVIRYIQRIIHVDFINEMITKHGEKKGFTFIEAMIKEFNVSIRTFGEENIPSEGRYIFASNHPLGGFDGLVLLHVLKNHFPNMKFLVNDILMNIKNLEELFIPINKHGAHSRENARKIEEAYASNDQILTFPAGLVSRKIKGKIIDLEWKKNFINKAIVYKRDIIPVHFDGRNTDFFYNLAKLRKFLHIKSNLEMFYLSDETYKHKNKTISVTFGKPISWKTFDNSRKPSEWAEAIKNEVYNLEKS